VGKLVTFSALRESVRQRYDLPTTFSTSTFITLAHVNELINASLSAFYGMLGEAYGDSYFAARATLSVAANAPTTALPATCVKLIRLWWVRGTDDVIQIRRGTADDLRLISYAPRPWTGCGPRYRLAGQTVQWLPAPSVAATVACDFVAVPADLVTDSETFEAGPGWQEWVVNDVCVKIAHKEETSPAGYQAERADWERRIRAQMPERDEAEALRLGDTGDGSTWESHWSRRDRLMFEDW